MVKMLLEHEYTVTALDNLSSGHRDAVAQQVRLVVSDLSQRGAVYQFLERNDFDAVMHFASFIDVAESVRDRARLSENNVANTLKLLGARIARMMLCSHSAVRSGATAIP